MNKKDKRYQVYLDILKKELLEAMGCTEPIAVAYCSAKARDVLGAFPDSVLVEVSGNIIKNVKSVIVPNTGGAKGIETAAAIGLIAGDASKALQVISQVNQQQKEEMVEFLDKKVIKVEPLESTHPLDIKITLSKEDHQATVHILDDHTNIVDIIKDGEVLFHKEAQENQDDAYADYEFLDIESIWDFAKTCDLEEVRTLLEKQILDNGNIAAEGLSGDYGANIGKVLLTAYGDDLKVRARAMAAAGSDARMNGCENERMRAASGYQLRKR